MLTQKSIWDQESIDLTMTQKGIQKIPRPEFGLPYKEGGERLFSFYKDNYYQSKCKVIRSAHITQTQK